MSSWLADKGGWAAVPVCALGAIALVQSGAFGQSSSGGKSFEDQLRQIEQRRVQALVTGDHSVTERFTADDYHLISPYGTIDDKDAEVEAAGRGFYVSMTPGPIAVRRSGRDSAILRYQITAVVKLRSGLHQGRYWHTDYYERRNGQWQVVWSQSTEIREPAQSAPPRTSQ